MRCILLEVSRCRGKNSSRSSILLPQKTWFGWDRFDSDCVMSEFETGLSSKVMMDGIDETRYVLLEGLSETDNA